MNACNFDVIDWHRPWLKPFTATAAQLLQEADWRSALNAAVIEKGLCNHCGLPVRFVPQASLPAGVPYEAYISTTGCVPTRDNLHDFFNALVWLTFPQAKIRLNALQAAEIARAARAENIAIGATRGKLRDAATIFDENAALLVVRDKAWIEALRMHRWHEVFVERRQAFQHECEIWLFGHALMEKLVTPYKAITAHAWPILVEDASFFEMTASGKKAWLDHTVAQQLSTDLTTLRLTPLPVLGVPEWWDGQDAEFYADPAVFRPKRGDKPGRNR